MDVTIVTRSAFFGPIRFTSDHKSVARIDQLNRLNLHVVELWVGVQTPSHRSDIPAGLALQLVWRRESDGSLTFPNETRSASDLFGDEHKLSRRLPSLAEIKEYVDTIGHSGPGLYR